MRRDELNLPDPPPYDRPGDSWTCGDSNGCCPNGPSNNGRCPLATPCTPTRTWQGNRRRIAFGVAALMVGFIGICMLPSAAPSVFKPGPLANPHKQILAGTLTSERCTACHRSASISPQSWFNSAGESHANVSQSDRCLDCHHQTIKPGVAKLAHNLPAGIRSQIRHRIQLASAKSNDQSWHDRLPGPAINQENVECSACHREHRGSQADLLAVSDSQCQTCHSDRFGDFATSHPEWSDWPYGRGGDIAFDHQSHMAKHFPKTFRNGLAVEFRCTTCHQKTDDNELTRSVSYEVGCKSCHDEALNTESSKGIELVALPLIPDEAARKVGSWPAEAVGMTDGSLTPLTELLLRSDAAATGALRDFPSRHLGNSPGSSANAIIPIAKGQRTLLQELAFEGQDAFVQRAIKAGVTPQSVLDIVRNLPPQLIYQSYQNWFGEPGPILPNQTNRYRRSGVQLVDFVEEIKRKRDATATNQNKTRSQSILLPMDDPENDWLGEIRVAQKRPQTQRIIKNLDSASDDDLLGGDVTMPRSLAPKTRYHLPAAPSLANPSTTPSATRPRTFSDPGSLLQLAPDDSTLLGSEKIVQPRPKKTNQPNEQMADQLLDGDDLLTDRGGTDSLLLPPVDTTDMLTDDLLGGSTKGGDLLNDTSKGDGLLGDDLVGDDPLALDPLSEDPLMHNPLESDTDLLTNDPLALPPDSSKRTPAKRFNPSEMIPAGGWYRDDLRLSIGYRASGHSDPVLRAAVEMVRQLPTNDPIRHRLLATRSISACVSCHSAVTRTLPSWTGRQLVGDKTQFTKFAHGPHLNVAGLSDCVHCHKVKKDGESLNPISLAAFSDEANPHNFSGHEFLPMKRAACAACHTARAAGESCVQCHRYHIEQ